jgi:hypothetical protein
MASYYVYSGAGGSNNGTNWANAYTTLAAAFSGKLAGDVFYVAHDHSESAAGVTLTSAGTNSNPSKVICVDRSGSVPPVSADRRATAQITATGANNLQISGSTHYDGIILVAGSGASSTGFMILSATNNIALRFDNCSLQLGIAAAGSVIAFAGASNAFGGCYFELNNTTLSFAHVGGEVVMAGTLKWRNTPSALLGSVPTFLFTAAVQRGGSVECSGVDFSAAGSGKTLVDLGVNTQGFSWRFIDCKLNASVTKDTTITNPAHGANTVDFLRSGSAGVNYTVYRSLYSGTLSEETTIVRTGGASDGTTTIAWKIVTSAFSTYSLLFECPPIAIWNDVVGSSVTATVEGIWGGGAVPNDDDIWLDVEYLGSSSSPSGSFVNDGKADLLTTAAGQTSSTATWGGSTTKFKLAVSFTPQQKGWIYVRVKCAKASSTFYIDPLVTLT